MVKKKKNSAFSAVDLGINPWVKENPWSRKWQPTPVFLPGKSHGERSLVEYHPWDSRVRQNLECLLRRSGSAVDCCRAGALGAADLGMA